ncbi:MAG: hypothetical protein ACE5H8_10600 [Alphaproteobacteria bacterium]
MIARNARRASNAAARRNVDALCELLRAAIARECRRRTVVEFVPPLRPTNRNAAKITAAEVVTLAAYHPAGMTRRRS